LAPGIRRVEEDMILAGLAALAGAQALRCPALSGADEVFRRPGVRVVWVGEVHGTMEAPRLFADLVCHAALTGRPVAIALEREDVDQAAWDRFLGSAGTEADRRALTSSESWTWKLQDGRSGLGMLALAERLRIYHQAGAVTGLRMILTGAAPRDAAGRERSMAAEVMTLAQQGPTNGLVLAYSGAFHATRAMADFASPPYAFAAFTLPQDQVISISIVGGAGKAWNCQPALGCGPHPTGDARGSRRRGLYAGAGEPGIDWLASTGATTTASLPADPASRVPLSAQALQAFMRANAPAKPTAAP
jgi:hypothetical protein